MLAIKGIESRIEWLYATIQGLRQGAHNASENGQEGAGRHLNAVADSYQSELFELNRQYLLAVTPKRDFQPGFMADEIQ